MSRSCTVSKIKQDISWKPQILTYPTCIWRRQWRWPHSNFPEFFCTRKRRVPGLLCGIVCVILRLLFWQNFNLRQTDGRTQGHSIHHAIIASHDNKKLTRTWKNIFHNSEECIAQFESALISVETLLCTLVESLYVHCHLHKWAHKDI